MIVIVYTRPSGRVCVVHPGWKAQRKSEKDEDFIKRVINKIPKYATNIKQMDESEIPADKTFRNAWIQDENMDIVVDMKKARLIQMDRIMEAREKESKKQLLIDLSSDVDLEVHTTPDALKAFWPTKR